MDTSVAARIVSEKCGIYGLQLQNSIFLRINNICEEMAIPPETAVEIMCQRWKEYLEARDRISYPFRSAANFFFSVDWNEPERWTWIRSTPKPAATPVNKFLSDWEQRRKAVAAERGIS